MRTWMIPWLFPVGLVGATMLVTLNSLIGQALVVVWGMVIIGVALMIMRASPEGRARLQDLETNYWRSGRR